MEAFRENRLTSSRFSKEKHMFASLLRKALEPCDGREKRGASTGKERFRPCRGREWRNRMHRLMGGVDGPGFEGTHDEADPKGETLHAFGLTKVARACRWPRCHFSGGQTCRGWPTVASSGCHSV